MSNTTLVDKLNDTEMYARRAIEDKNGYDISTSYALKSTLSKVAFSGVYYDLDGRPDFQSRILESDSIAPLDSDHLFVRLKDDAVQGTNLSGLKVNSATYVSSTGAPVYDSSLDFYYFNFANGITTFPGENCNGKISNATYDNDASIRFAVVNASSFAEITSASKFAISTDITSMSNFLQQSGGTIYMSTFVDAQSTGFDFSDPTLVFLLDGQADPYTSDILSTITTYRLTVASRYLLTAGDFTWQYQNHVLTNPGLSIDTSVVATKSDLNGKQDALTAGSNITINPTTNTISATDTTYTAGNMMSLNNGAFGVSTTAGITDIQIVQQMPQAPVATVLYIIPEN